MKITKEHLHVADLVGLKNLQALGARTRLQLQTMGLDPATIRKLEKLGILLKELNTSTNLNEYKVNDAWLRAL